MRSHLQERARLGPVALLVEVLDALVDEDLPVLGLGDAEPLERARRGALEVDAGLVEAAAVARTFELVLGGEPARRATQVGALGEQRVEALLGADDPDALVLLELLAHLTDRDVLRVPRLEGRGRRDEHAREGRADRGHERQPREAGEDGPREASEDVASRPEPPQLRPLAGTLLALPLLLDLAAGRENGRIFLLRLGLGHRSGASGVHAATLRDHTQMKNAHVLHQAGFRTGHRGVGRRWKRVARMPHSPITTATASMVRPTGRKRKRSGSDTSPRRIAIPSGFVRSAVPTADAARGASPTSVRSLSSSIAYSRRSCRRSVPAPFTSSAICRVSSSISASSSRSRSAAGAGVRWSSAKSRVLG